MTRGVSARTLRDGEKPCTHEEDVIPALDPATGLLPVGRHACTEAEVEAMFVSAPQFAASPTRADVWAHWKLAVGVLQASALVHAAWIGGSFSTAKPDPADIDVTFIVNRADYRLRPPQDQQVVSAFDGQLSAVAPALEVDSYLIGWECCLFARGVPHHETYFADRGYWDDWWQRSRTGPKGTPPVPADARPRRGYLEVLFSDYP